MFQPTKEWVNKVNLSSFELENFFKFGACVISARKAKQLDATTMFTYSHANTALGQSERAYYLSYFIKTRVTCMSFLQVSVLETEDLCFGLFLRTSPQISISTSVASED